MKELSLELDEKANDDIDDLMNYYGVGRANIVKKALAVLKIAAYVSKTNGELLARKGLEETTIVVK